MSRVVRRYRWNPSDIFTVEMPIGAVAIGVQLIEDRPWILALVTKSTEGTARRRFIAVATDEPFPDGNWRYLGTLFNLHLFTD